jgi:hypothetical protein
MYQHKVNSVFSQQEKDLLFLCLRVLLHDILLFVSFYFLSSSFPGI